jgi:hypothetical protein
MKNQGWIGSWNELANVLRTFHCDRDPDGKFCVAGSIASFMGAGDEFTVGEDAVYFVDGKPRNLVSALYATSYGQKVTVI